MPEALGVLLLALAPPGANFVGGLLAEVLPISKKALNRALHAAAPQPDARQRGRGVVAVPDDGAVALPGRLLHRPLRRAQRLARAPLGGLGGGGARLERLTRALRGTQLPRVLSRLAVGLGRFDGPSGPRARG